MPLRQSGTPVRLRASKARRVNVLQRPAQDRASASRPTNRRTASAQILRMNGAIVLHSMYGSSSALPERWRLERPWTLLLSVTGLHGRTTRAASVSLPTSTLSCAHATSTPPTDQPGCSASQKQHYPEGAQYVVINSQAVTDGPSSQNDVKSCPSRQRSTATQRDDERRHEDGCQKIDWGPFDDTPNGQWQRENYEYIERALHGSLWRLPFRFGRWMINHYAAQYYAAKEASRVHDDDDV